MIESVQHYIGKVLRISLYPSRMLSTKIAPERPKPDQHSLSLEITQPLDFVDILARWNPHFFHIIVLSYSGHDVICTLLAIMQKFDPIALFHKSRIAGFPFSSSTIRGISSMKCWASFSFTQKTIVSL
jgi:hypothetical protein